MKEELVKLCVEYVRNLVFVEEGTMEYFVDSLEVTSDEVKELFNQVTEEKGIEPFK